MTTSIPCPECGTDIDVQMFALLSGKSIQCSKCRAEISLASSDHDEIRQKMEALGKLRDPLSDDKGGTS